jgi:hypothetical protein
MNQAMSPPKLILLEGIPGSGKFSAGEFVQGLLQRQGLAVRFWREGDFDHPADFEGVAGLSEGYYRELLARFSQPVPDAIVELRTGGTRVHPDVVPQSAITDPEGRYLCINDWHV